MKELEKDIKRKYSISEFDPNWAVKFESIKRLISDNFRDKALSIEHVGSTSVQGMKAKPLIDVLVIVKDINDLSEEISKMANAGYEWVENYIAPDTLIFFKVGPDGEKLENIHVCEQGAPMARQLLVMRDFFRKFPLKAKEYSDLKEEIFQKYPDDYIAYRAAKSSLLSQMENEAYEWEEGNK
jgi:GrpB-like predicted nucleotidyltransferase (UPF0157 family)